MRVFEGYMWQGNIQVPCMVHVIEGCATMHRETRDPVGRVYWAPEQEVTYGALASIIVAIADGTLKEKSPSG